MENTTERIINYLEENNIAFSRASHSSAGGVEEYRQTMGTRLQQQAKALFVRVRKASGKSFAIVAIQAQKKADLNQICRLLGAKEVKLAIADQLKETTGCNYGELPPLGKIFAVPLLMDKDLLNEEAIYFNAGSLTLSIIMKPYDLMKLEDPILF